MGQILHGSATTTEAVRRAIQHSQESLRALAEALRDQSEDRCEVEEAGFGRRSADRSEGAKVDGAVDRGGGDHRRFSTAHAAAAGRLPLCAAADDSTPDPFVTASLPAAPWHRPTAGCRGRQAGEEEVQGYPIGYFHIDIAEVQTAEGQALSLRRHRPNLQVRLRGTAREGHDSGSQGIPAPADRGRSLQASIPC